MLTILNFDWIHKNKGCLGFSEMSVILYRVIIKYSEIALSNEAIIVILDER